MAQGETMKLVVCLDKEDIHTKLCGHNYVVETTGLSLSFTPEAAQELVNDIQGIQAALAKDTESQPCQDPNCTEHH